MSFEIVV